MLEALKSALDHGHALYTAPPGLPQLRTAIAAYLKRTRSIDTAAENVLVAPGCKMILALIMMTLVDTGDEVLYPDPGFPIYSSLIRMLGGRPVSYGAEEANYFQPDIKEIVAKITPRTRVLILNSPSNPTGMVASREVLEALA